MRERAVLVGDAPSLVGVLTEPSIANAVAATTGVVLLNAGVVHRVGPNRLHVQLARALADAGFPVLRFDLSGLGDSDSRRDGLSYFESSPIETRAAMNFMAASLPVERFVLFGICSGAGTAFRVALEDQRVAGIVMVDPYAYPTLQFRVRYYARRIGQRSSWYNALFLNNPAADWVRRRLGSAHASDKENSETLTAIATGALPTRDSVASALRHLIDRGVHISLVFSGVPSNYNYQRQFEDAFPDVPLKGLVDVSYFKDADHTFSRLRLQGELTQSVCRWVKTWLSSSAHLSVGGVVPAAVLCYFL